jgi:hypothetical protein
MEHIKHRAFQKELYNGISNVTVWRVLRKRLHLKAYKLSIQGVERWIIYMYLSTNVFVTLVTQNIIVRLFLKHPALPVQVTLNRNNPR